MIKKLLIFVVLFLSPLVSNAGAVITSLNGFYTSKNIQNADNSSTESTQSYLSLNLNYWNSYYMIMGLMYYDDSIDSGSNIEKTKGYGPSLGFLIGNWGLEYALLPAVEYKPSSSTQEKWSGSGYQLTLSFLGSVNQGLFWGFQWVYRNSEYKKYFDGIVQSELKRTTTESFPQVKMGYAF